MPSTSASVAINYVIVPQIFESVLNVQSGLQQVELFVLIDYFLGETETIKRFAFQTEYSLGSHIAGCGDGTAG